MTDNSAPAPRTQALPNIRLQQVAVTYLILAYALFFLALSFWVFFEGALGNSSGWKFLPNTSAIVTLVVMAAPIKQLLGIENFVLGLGGGWFVSGVGRRTRIAVFVVFAAMIALSLVDMILVGAFSDNIRELGIATDGMPMAEGKPGVTLLKASDVLSVLLAAHMSMVNGFLVGLGVKTFLGGGKAGA